MWSSHLHYELGKQIHAGFFRLTPFGQDIVLRTILNFKVGEAPRRKTLDSGAASRIDRCDPSFLAIRRSGISNEAYGKIHGHPEGHAGFDDFLVGGAREVGNCAKRAPAHQFAS
ncbi:hypothetical protein P0D88_50780 [Paraburkholderia sp. RL18-103-BIB-C]|uniref:hypothetical protein n=1 Tax=unclassified Paraburkholderia TaxID=2615204 RepID=UPI0038BABD7A